MGAGQAQERVCPPPARVPAFIMHGKKGPYCQDRIGQELHRGLGGSQLFKFEGGHIFFLIRERKPFLEIMAGCL
jgi:pimeloyl-ACP methyl ester carboxylesterase